MFTCGLGKGSLVVSFLSKAMKSLMMDVVNEGRQMTEKREEDQEGMSKRKRRFSNTHAHTREEKKVTMDKFDDHSGERRKKRLILHV